MSEKKVSKIEEVEKMDKKAKDKKEEIKLFSGNEQYLTIVAGTEKDKCSFRIPFGIDFKFAYDCCFSILSAIKETNDLAIAKQLEESNKAKTQESKTQESKTNKEPDAKA